MKLTTKINYIVLVSLLVFLAYCSRVTFDDLFIKTKQALSHSALISQNKDFEVRCASGYTKLPIELSESYSEQSEHFENTGISYNSLTKLKYETEFYGYTYSTIDSKNSDDSLSRCFEQKTSQGNIEFVNKEINNIVQMYISAVVFNEVAAFDAQVNIVENDPRQVKINQLRLCLNANCGLKNNNEDYKSFTYINLADIKYARTFSDSTLFTTTRDYLIDLDDKSIASSLTGSEITQMLTQARIMAYDKADEINK